ncbi:hypothetical protein L1049_016635 [Liquidambar formosana]|uniref:Uncharacterized protein n=1 Tax=Liquidambar formosana TaxID=63359 RepID=A0AAP0RZI5_LIQFO
MTTIGVLLGSVEGIWSELGSLGVPCIESVICFTSEKKKLMNTLTRTRAVLLDAEKQEEKTHTTEDWLEKLKDILYDAEDLVDELTDAHRNKADKVLSFISTPRFYAVMYFKVNTIRRKLNDVVENYTKFLVVHEDAGSKYDYESKDREKPQSYVLPTAVFGRDEDKEKIKKLLENNEHNVSIIPIVGMGGLGKTTLAKLVYNDAKDFDLKMWVRVSYDFDVATLVKKVIKVASNAECPNLPLDLLQHVLRKNLGRKKFLLVLDDVWNTNRESWIVLENLLMGGERGSVILVTTRDWDAARIMGITGSPYVLRGLSGEDCCSLFKQLVFKPGQVEETPGLLSIGDEILAKCGGNPLAITTVAGLLRGKYTESEWSKVNNQLWELAREDDDILPTLRIGYAHLPPIVQRCFSYCSIFPKGFVFEKATLIQLWMAQSFIQPSSNMLLEDIGDEYFRILWKKSFFQDEKMDAYGNVIICKMDVLTHDLAQTVAGFECSIVNDDMVNISERLIHASVSISRLEEITTLLVRARKLRTLLMTGGCSCTRKQDFDKFTSSFKSLRALIFGGFSCCGSSYVLNSIGELKHLRYLDLSESNIETLPNSVCDLRNLQTLKLNYCKSLTELPRDIKKLINLRHLLNHGCDKLEGMPSGFCQLTAIQTLPIFVLGSGGLSELEGLNNLRGELRIKDLENARHTTSESRKTYLKEKKYLQTLTLCWETNEGNGDEDAALFEGLQPHSNLMGLHIRGYGDMKFPSWMFNMGNSLPHLVEVTLEYCPSCVCFPLFADLRFLKVFKFSSLNSLEYIDSYISDSPSSSSSFKEIIPSGAREWFPSLQEVGLSSLPKLKKWSREVVVVNDGGKAKTEAIAEQRKQLLSLNSLSKLTIGRCPELTSMPLHPHVVELALFDISEALIQSMMEAATISPTAAATTSLLPSFSVLSKLKSLSISFCDDLVSLPKGWLENLPSIEHLEIQDCSELESISRETHHLTAPDMLRSLEGKMIDLSEEEDDLQGFRSLCSLQFHHLPKLTSLPKGLQQATKLKEVSIIFCHSLVTLLESMENIRSLQYLTIVDCKKIASLPRGLQHLTALERLKISNCPELNFSDEDNDIPGLRSLHLLQLKGLPKLVSLPKVLQHATALKYLVIEECSGLMTLPDWLGNLTSLRQLEISFCDELKSLPKGMPCFTALQELTIQGCPYLSETCQKETGKDWTKIAHIPEIELDGQWL